MRLPQIPVVLGAFVLSAVPAAAQPTLYVCTPTAQVLQVDGTSGATSVLFSGSGTFHDCVLGPDGWLYIANDANIVRFNPATSSAAFVNSSALAFQVSGLAFNVTTLYLTSGGSAVYRWVGSETSDGAPLSFPGSPSALPFSIGSPGRGVVFDAQGNMVLASDSKLHRSSAFPAPPAMPYSSASQLIPSGITPFGVAVNTCKEIVFADAATQSIRRFTGSGHSAISGLTFSGKDTPRYIEIASNNDTFIVTTDDKGVNGKVWKADFPFATQNAGSCASATATLLVELKPLSTGSSAILNSHTAMGIALSATNYDITNTFSATQCTHTYNFGYHSVMFGFTDCANAFPGSSSTQLKIEALKSTLSQVSFDPLVFTATPVEGIRYSPMGGFPIQYRLTVVGEHNPFPTPFQELYGFFTQEPIGTPGLARTANDGVTAPYDEIITQDYWDLGVLDPWTGGRGNDISKRVVFNSGLAQTCTLTVEEPVLTGNPQFKTGQSVTIKVNAASVANGAPCVGGTVQVSVARLVGSSFEVIQVTSKGGAQTENFLSPSGPGKYTFNLDTTGYLPGIYQITVWGNLAPPTSFLINAQ